MIAFVQPYGLQAHGGGARILRSLLADSPVPYAIINTSPWPGPVAPAEDEIRLRRRPAAGRLDSTRLAPLLAHADIWFGGGFRERLRETCRSLGATAVHA